MVPELACSRHVFCSFGAGAAAANPAPTALRRRRRFAACSRFPNELFPAPRNRAAFNKDQPETDSSPRVKTRFISR